LLYKDKNYKREADYIQSLIIQFAKKGTRTLLDIGCGTGMHAYYMTELGYEVTGIDTSQEMITQAIAKEIPNSDFRVENASCFSLAKKFDVIISLFHVLSYHTVTANAMAMIKNAAEHLNENGILIFDFWYGPPVLTEKPSIRIKRLEDDEVKVTRIAEPVLKIEENIVDVNFELLIQEKSSNQYTIVKEVHPMRYFFKPEIEQYLDFAALKSLHFREWMTGRVPSTQSWGVCCVASHKYIN
jgi:SAM-dependent methyltransferase